MARAAQATGGDLIETADRFIEQDAHDAQAGVLYHGRFHREEGAKEAAERDDGRDEHGAEQNGIEKAQAENARTSVRHPGCVVLAGEGRRGLAEGGEMRRVQGRASVRAPACGEGEDRHTRAGRPTLSAAGARRKDRSDGAAGEERRSPENKVHHVGGLRDNGDGREGAGHRHTAGADIAAHPVQDRDTAACTAVLPADRTCDEGPAPPLLRGAELRLLSQARRRVR